MAKDLLFITNHRLGDAVLTSGLLGESLRRFSPDRVTIVCGPVPAALFCEVPQLERISVVDRSRPAEFWFEFWKSAVVRQWDVVIDVRKTIISYLLRSRHAFRFKNSDTGTHKTLQLAAMIGGSTPPPYQIWLAKDAEAKADEIMPRDRPILAICPGAGWPAKQWPAQRFCEVTRRIISQLPRFAGGAVTILGAAHERALGQELADNLGRDHQVIDLTGQTDPLEAAACLSRCSLVLSNDSGLMHLAAAVHVPTIGLFGPSNETVYRPLGPRTTIVRSAEIGTSSDPHMLMLAISVDDVFHTARNLCNMLDTEDGIEVGTAL